MRWNVDFFERPHGTSFNHSKPDIKTMSFSDTEVRRDDCHLLG